MDRWGLGRVCPLTQMDLRRMFIETKQDNKDGLEEGMKQRMLGFRDPVFPSSLLIRLATPGKVRRTKGLPPMYR